MMIFSNISYDTFQKCDSYVKLISNLRKYQTYLEATVNLRFEWNKYEMDY